MGDRVCLCQWSVRCYLYCKAYLMIVYVDHNGFTPCTDQEEIDAFINDIVLFLEEDERVHAYAYSNGLGLGDVWPLTKGPALRFVHSPSSLSGSNTRPVLLGGLILPLSVNFTNVKHFTSTPLLRDASTYRYYHCWSCVTSHQRNPNKLPSFIRKTIALVPLTIGLMLPSHLWL